MRAHCLQGRKHMGTSMRDLNTAEFAIVSGGCEDERECDPYYNPDADTSGGNAGLRVARPADQRAVPRAAAAVVAVLAEAAERPPAAKAPPGSAPRSPTPTDLLPETEVARARFTEQFSSFSGTTKPVTIRLVVNERLVHQ